MSANVPITYFLLYGPPHHAAEDMHREYEAMRTERAGFVKTMFGERKMYTGHHDRVVAFAKTHPKEQPPPGLREKEMDVLGEDGCAYATKLFIVDKRTKIGKTAAKKLDEFCTKDAWREKVGKAMGLDSTAWFCPGGDGRRYIVHLSLQKFGKEWCAGVATHVLVHGEERGRADSIQKVIPAYCRQLKEWEYVRLYEESERAA